TSHHQDCGSAVSRAEPAQMGSVGANASQHRPAASAALGSEHLGPHRSPIEWHERQTSRQEDAAPTTGAGSTPGTGGAREGPALSAYGPRADNRHLECEVALVTAR